MRFGLALAAGATLFLLLAGAAIALGAAPLFARVTFTSVSGRLLRLAVGGVLVLLGFWQWRGIAPGAGTVFQVVKPLLDAQARLRRDRPTLSFGLFGFGYILAGFGCTGPILAGLAGHALTSGGRLAAFSAFAAAATTMALLMLSLALLIGAAQQGLVAALKERTQPVRRWSGAILLLVGVWLIALAIWSDFFARIFPV